MKLKVKQKSNQTVIRVTLEKSEEIVDRELAMLTSNTKKSLFRPTLKKRFLFMGDSLEYIGPQSVSLTTYLKNIISKQNFYFIATQIISVISYLQTANLSRSNLMLDSQYIFINHSTSELFFIYLPILSSHFSFNALDFFGKFLHLTNPDRNEDNGYLGDFSRFLSTQSVFSIEEFKRFICSQDNFAASQFQRMDRQSGFITPNRIEYNEHYQKSVDGNTSANSKNPLPNGYIGNEGTISLNQGNSFANDFNMPVGYNPACDMETTSLMQSSLSEMGTTVLNQNQMGYFQQQHFPYLIRCSTGERIEVNKPAFRLGKESRYVDYFVSNNDTVSRSHADIITRNGHHYVMDLHTTNYTYINGTMLPDRTEVEIFDGNILKLANEEFEFHVQ